MRLLLAAMRCDKGGAPANVDRHLELVAAATADSCDLAVFPEMSLTGYVAASATELHSMLDEWAVRQLVAATAGGAGAVFGIVEHCGGGAPPAIAQVAAVDGEVVAVQRKRYLGEGEDAYATCAGDAWFDVGGVRAGIAICAESAHDQPFDAARSLGARVVLLCAAPGLHGRRVTEEDWRAGWEWWRATGLADARRQARRTGAWVALATQAGSTQDEDFPGLAALVDPTGEVVAETADRREATLVVELSAAGSRPRARGR